jgi:hypothetical protein
MQPQLPVKPIGKICAGGEDNDLLGRCIKAFRPDELQP